MTTPTSTEQYLTRGGITVRRTIESVPVRHAVEPILEGLDQRRGALLTSSYEYPGRYTRWDLGFIDPPVVLTARGRRFRAEALNARGRVLLPALGRTLSGLDVVAAIDTRDDVVEGEVRAPAGRFTEEDRSRQPSVFSLLRALVDLFFHEDEPHLGLYGAFGYDLAFQFEPVRLKLERPPEQRDLVLYLPDELIVVDHRREVAQRRRYEFEVDGRATDGLPRDGAARPYVGHAEAPRAGITSPGTTPPSCASRASRSSAATSSRSCPARPSSPGSPRPPSELFRRLREWNPSPYGFLISLGEAEYLVGASPEMYVRVDGDRVETCPISGTIARGRDPIGDAAQILALLTSAKDASELTMCTDVDRNDKSRICVPGSVRVIGRRQIEMYSRLIHTVDHVEGRLLPGLDALDAFLAHTWAVTVTGAPKPWAMQFIEDHERSPRAWYGGAVGLVGFDGNLNTGLTLRTVRVKDGIAEVRVGATLLYDSDPDEEERETHLKASAFLDALRRPARTATSEAVEPPQPGRGKRILLVDHQDSFVHTLANYLRQTGAAVTTLRAGFPRGRARRPRSRPGRAVAGARHAGGLRRLGHAAHALGARHPRLRRLPRAAGHGRAFRRRARRPRLPDARQGLPHPRGRGPPVRGIAEGVFGRTLPLAVRDPRPVARRPGRDGRDRGRRGHGRGAPHPAARRRPVPSRVHPDPRRRPGPAPLAERRRDAPRVMSESSTQRRSPC
jgi:anthranilate synthase